MRGRREASTDHSHEDGERGVDAVLFTRQDPRATRHRRVPAPHGPSRRQENCETRELDANVASLEHTIPDEHFGTLDEATTPHLDFPADLIKTITTDFVQAGATINAVESRQFSRGY